AWVTREMLLEFDANFVELTANPTRSRLFKQALKEVDLERKGALAPRPDEIEKAPRKGSKADSDSSAKSGFEARSETNMDTIPQAGNKSDPKAEPKMDGRKRLKLDEQTYEECGLTESVSALPKCQHTEAIAMLFKRGRRRPLKSHLSPPPPNAVENMGTQLDTLKWFAPVNNEAIVPAKRGRGRPPKNLLLLKSPTAEENASPKLETPEPITLLNREIVPAKRESTSTTTLRDMTLPESNQEAHKAQLGLVDEEREKAAYAIKQCGARACSTVQSESTVQSLKRTFEEVCNETSVLTYHAGGTVIYKQAINVKKKQAWHSLTKEVSIESHWLLQRVTLFAMAYLRYAFQSN
ncbi:hypothetical protein L0F63_003218, partial [Massospora cicadina]